MKNKHKKHSKLPLALAISSLVIGLGLMAYSVKGLLYKSKAITISAFTPNRSMFGNYEVADPNEQPKASKLEEKPSIIILNSKTTVIFNEVVTSESVAQLQKRLQEMSIRLPNDTTITLVMYTPGGEVYAGMELIDTIRALPQHIRTLTIFSASMGFHIVQSTDGERLILPSGTLMSHRAKGGMEGEFDGNFDVRYAAARQRLNVLDQSAADRMGLSLPAYKELIRDEFWTSGKDAITDQAADTVVLARCDESLSGTYVKEVNTFFGPVAVTFSKCPLIVAPLSIKFNSMNLEHAKEIEQLINEEYSNPSEFIKDYLNTGKYKTFLKN